jgi:hypothetical protein
MPDNFPNSAREYAMNHDKSMYGNVRLVDVS